MNHQKTHSAIVLRSIAAFALAAAATACAENPRPADTPASYPSTTGAPVEGTAKPAAAEPAPATAMTLQAQPMPAPAEASTTPPAGQTWATGATPGTTPAPMAPMAQAAPSTSAAAPMTDAQIVAIMDAAFTGALDQSREVAHKAKVARVRQFADRIVSERTDAQSKLVALMSKAAIAPKANPTADRLRSGNDRAASTLRSATGKDADHDYIDARVIADRELLDLLDDQLIPQAQSKELKAYMGSLRSTIADDVKAAQDVQAAQSK